MKHKTRWFASGSLVILFAIQLLGCSALQSVNQSKTTCNNFLTQMQAKQLNSAYTLLSSKNISVAPASKVQNTWNFLETQIGKVQSWTQKDFQFYSGTDGTSVNLRYTITCSEGFAIATFVCAEENSKRLIQRFDYVITSKNLQ